MTGAACIVTVVDCFAIAVNPISAPAAVGLLGSAEDGTR